MKKIMLNDKYGLTQAVLEGRKTMTRRIVHMPDDVAEDDVSFYDFCIDDNDLWCCTCYTFDAGKHAEKQFDIRMPYQPGETVAIAQKYWDLRECDAFYKALGKADPTFPLECIGGEKGCYNKMFVRADWMPHRIRFTDLSFERLQDISEEDCLKEGVEKWMDCYIVSGIMERGGKNNVCFDTPREAFAALIDRISGRGTWKSNPWAVAYEFELIK